MKWITREKVKVDRVACPWLIRNFVDPNCGVCLPPPRHGLVCDHQWRCLRCSQLCAWASRRRRLVQLDPEEISAHRSGFASPRRDRACGGFAPGASPRGRRRIALDRGRVWCARPNGPPDPGARIRGLRCALRGVPTARHANLTRNKQTRIEARLRYAVFTSARRRASDRSHDRSKKRPARARTMPMIRGIDAGSLKKMNPAIAIIAAPPARMTGTEDKGPPR